jgi:hypothetical protein
MIAKRGPSTAKRRKEATHQGCTSRGRDPATDHLTVRLGEALRLDPLETRARFAGFLILAPREEEQPTHDDHDRGADADPRPEGAEDGDADHAHDHEDQSDGSELERVTHAASLWRAPVRVHRAG